MHFQCHSIVVLYYCLLVPLGFVNGLLDVGGLPFHAMYVFVSMLYPLIHIACKAHQEIWFSSGLASATHFQLSGDWRMRLVCRIAVALVVPWILQTIWLCHMTMHDYAILSHSCDNIIHWQADCCRERPPAGPGSSKLFLEGTFQVHVARACYIATVLVNEADCGKSTSHNFEIANCTCSNPIDCAGWIYRDVKHLASPKFGGLIIVPNSLTPYALDSWVVV